MRSQRFVQEALIKVHFVTSIFELAVVSEGEKITACVYTYDIAERGGGMDHHMTSRQIFNVVTEVETMNKP